MGFAAGYVGILYKLRFVVPLVWIALAATGAYFTPKFLGNTNDGG
jgi:uncharacterized membrane protein YdfJ with MMPL/SSD domain